MMEVYEDNELNNTTEGDKTQSDEYQRAGDKIEVNLDGVARTLLFTLVARAHDFSTIRPILGDPHAQDILNRLDFDAAEMVMTPHQVASIALRTSQFDRWTSDFLQHNPGTTVLHLACGFDSRMDRVKWGGNTRWIDIDLPEVIELRRKVQPGTLTGRDYSLLGIDLRDEDWIHRIPHTDGPVIIVMEGLLCYLAEDDVKELLKRLCQNFREGEIMFECITTAALQNLTRRKTLQSISSTGVEFRSSVDDPKSLENLHPGLKLVESIRLVEAPGVERFPIGYRALMYLLSWIPGVRDSARFLRFKVGEVAINRQRLS